MRHRIATLLVSLVATGCASTSATVRGATPPPASPRATGLLFEHFSTFAAGDGLADEIVVLAVRGGDLAATHQVSLRFPSGSLRESWPDAEVRRGSLRWAFQVAPPARCADETEWPYERSLGCNTVDRMCVGAALDRWRTTDGCVTSSDSTLPVALARMDGIPIREGLPRLVRRGFEWGVEKPEGYADPRPIVIVDVLGHEGEPHETRLRLVRAEESFRVDHATPVSVQQARLAFAEYFAAGGVPAADAALAASFVFPEGHDPLDGLGESGALHGATVALFVPLGRAELGGDDSPPPDDASLSLSHAGVIRWADGTWPRWESFEERRRSGNACHAEDPETSQRVESSFSHVVSRCAYEARRRGSRPNGRIMVTLTRSSVDEVACGERWDENGDENPSYDEDACAGVSLEIEETTLVDEELLACLHRLGEGLWDYMPEIPVRCFATVATP